MTRTDRPVIAVILATGQGTRMRSRLPKVLHRVAGRPLLHWVLEAARAAHCDRTLVVVGHGGADQVRQAVQGENLVWVRQEEQRGTGHALAQVQAEVDHEATLLVLSGDVPLVSGDTLERLLDASRSCWGSMAVAELEEPGSVGRVLAGENGGLQAIVEAADASAEELKVKCVNAGLYALPAPGIFELLAALEPHNVKGERYLTEALTAAARQGHTVALVDLPDPLESFGVNTRADQARAHQALLRRKAADLMAAGVTLLEPERIVVEGEVAVGRDTIVHAGVSLLGLTSVGEGCVLHQGVWLRDAVVGDRVEIAPYSVMDGVEVAEGCRIGPFARLRPGTVIGRDAKVGNFVEVKNSNLGEGVKANHLAYIGDAAVGSRSNIGAGAVTCNYDGRQKHPTTIGRDVLVGSDTMLVAPVEIGDGAMTAAGSVVSKNVPAGALAVERVAQRNIPGWVKRFRRRRKK